MNKMLFNTFNATIKIYYLNFKYLITILFDIKNKNTKLYFEIIDIIKSFI